jgi:hypothetical protein
MFYGICGVEFGVMDYLTPTYLMGAVSWVVVYYFASTIRVNLNGIEDKDFILNCVFG